MTEKRIKPTAYFLEHPIFTIEEFNASTPSRPSGTVKALLRYHIGRGNLKRIRRGLYVRDDWFEPFVVASRFAPDVVLAYDTALLLMRDWSPPLTELERITYLTSSFRSRPRKYVGIEFKPILPPAVLGKDWARFGVRTAERSGQKIKLTTPERTIVDVLDHIALAPPPTELWEMLVFSALDYEAMVRHVRALGRQIVAARLGFLLEHLPGMPDKLLRALEKIGPSSPVYFDRPRQTGTSAFARRWNLVVTARLYQTVLRTDFRGRTPSLPKETELPD